MFLPHFTAFGSTPKSDDDSDDDLGELPVKNAEQSWDDLMKAEPAPLKLRNLTKAKSKPKDQEEEKQDEFDEFGLDEAPSLRLVFEVLRNKIKIPNKVLLNLLRNGLNRRLFAENSIGFLRFIAK